MTRDEFKAECRRRVEAEDPHLSVNRNTIVLTTAIDMLLDRIETLEKQVAEQSRNAPAELIPPTPGPPAKVEKA